MTKTMPRGNPALYFDAVKADNAFAEALITEYGGRLANSMRYAQRTMAESTALRAAYDAKVAADDAWLGRLEFQTRPATLGAIAAAVEDGEAALENS